MIEIVFTVFYTIVGCLVGLVASFVPGLYSSNLVFILASAGVIASQQNFAVFIVSLEIGYSFFQFLAPILFGFSDDVAALALDSSQFFVAEGLVDKALRTIVLGGLVGVGLSLPLFLVAQKIYPVVYDSLAPIANWILIVICAYMVWIEKTWSKRASALIIFTLSGLLGFMLKDSGFLPANYMLPIFIGFFSFSFMFEKFEKKKNINENINKAKPACELPKEKKIRVSFISFLSAAFASFIPKMKASQASAIALQAGDIRKNEEILFALPAISMAFTVMSILVLGSTGFVRSTVAYELQELLGNMYNSQTLLLLGSLALATCFTASMMLLLSKPLSKNLNKINRKYLKVFGFCFCCVLVLVFTGWKGALLASISTCIGLLSRRLKVRSTHLMGVLLLPSILSGFSMLM